MFWMTDIQVLADISETLFDLCSHEWLRFHLYDLINQHFRPPEWPLPRKFSGPLFSCHPHACVTDLGFYCVSLARRQLETDIIHMLTP